MSWNAPERSKAHIAPRVTPLGVSDVTLPPCTQSALDIVRGYLDRRDAHGRSGLVAAPGDDADFFVGRNPVD